MRAAALIDFPLYYNLPASCSHGVWHFPWPPPRHHQLIIRSGNKTMCNVGQAKVPWCYFFIIGVFQVQFKVLLISYESSHGLGPGYLKDHLVLQASVQALWSTGDGLLQIQLIKEVMLENPISWWWTWNSFPREANLAPSAILPAASEDGTF